MDHQPLDSAVHHHLIASLLATGAPADTPELAARTDASPDDVRAALHRLDANHGVVLHPGSDEVWLLHPFSTTPTLFHVAGAGQSWWAPCIWCALGVADLADESVSISTLVAGEQEHLTISVEGDRITPDGLVAHFPIPVARAWDNVHRHCSLGLVFRSEADIDDWCGRHGVARGAVVPLDQLRRLAEAWYGGHLDPEWRKPTASEARARFESVGLTSDHWWVPDGDERF